MGRNAKRRLSCFLMALLLAVTGLETSAFTGVLAFAGTGVTSGDKINIFLAGDSTVKDYSTSGMYMNGSHDPERKGSWGEFLQSFFDSSKVTVHNYANGGRSSRSFINEGSLDKIKENIKAGDYLFIQFGHNDCSSGANYLADRYVPLGQPDANGIYPSNAGTKVPTPSEIADKGYGEEYYSWDCGGTYKWYLQQYIDVAKAVGAIPVLVTPVSRKNFDKNGNTKPHHDSRGESAGTQKTSNNAYVTAVKQLAEEQSVFLIDGFELTKAMFEEAYKADPSASSGKSAYAEQTMASKKGTLYQDGTHSNKLGGFISAAILAEAIQKMDINISSAVKAPSNINGADFVGNVFTLSAKSEFTAYSADADGNYTVKSDYWTTYGQDIISRIAANVSSGDETPDKPDDSQKATVWVIGDSTVCGFSDDYYYPRYGWGTQLYKYFDKTLTVQNLALSGRSSKSYILENNYKTLMSGMKSGDYLLIGFGHNDEKAEEGRYTNPNGDYKTEGSFANSLYENYIKPAQAAGVTVVVCTPIVRRTATGDWSPSNLHVTSDSGSFAGGDYAEAIRKLGTDLNVPVVDMTTMTKNLYDSLGAAETVNLHAWTSSKSGSVDNTHTNIWGATYNAYFITQEIKKQNVAGISSHIITAEAPEKSTTLVKNPNYKEAEYTPVTGESKLWKKAGVWSGSVFGDVGGNPSTTNQTLEQDENGNIHIAVRNNKGKISSSVDGLAMYYYKVPANSNFTLSATMTVNAFDANDQVTFGLMARDDMYLDLNTKNALGDYVAAAPYGVSRAAGSVWNCFARKNGVFTQGGTSSEAVVAGNSYDLKIVSNPDGYACTFSNQETVTGGFDFKLTSVDSDYVYVGMFASRNADVTFSNVALVVDGEVITGNPVIEKTDFTKLDAAVAEAEKLTAADYKDFTAVEKALAAAKNVNRETAAQVEVDKLTKALNDAVAALEKKEDKPDVPEDKKNGFYEEDGAKYWYENGVKQGTEGRGKEIYDPATDAWYWLDAVQGGAVAKAKDVYQESNGGKWVRYDENGLMIKGWNETEDGKYYFDLITGAMAKGTVNIDGVDYRFNEYTGTLLNNEFVNDDGNLYWYEGGIKQGTEGRGKEIYDPATDAWYWLDAIDGGKKAAGKDVYQESWAGQYADREDGTGKWVRYDENGAMVKGWNQQNGNTYYFDLITGAMAKGTTEIDGVTYTFDWATGALQK